MWCLWPCGFFVVSVCLCVSVPVVSVSVVSVVSLVSVVSVSAFGTESLFCIDNF